MQHRTPNYIHFAGLRPKAHAALFGRARRAAKGPCRFLRPSPAAGLAPARPGPPAAGSALRRTGPASVLQLRCKQPRTTVRCRYANRGAGALRAFWCLYCICLWSNAESSEHIRSRRPLPQIPNCIPDGSTACSKISKTRATIMRVPERRMC